MTSRLSVAALVLFLAIGATACSCPPVGNQGGGRGTRDPSSVTFAFLGGLRCFFGENSAPAEEKPVVAADLTDRKNTLAESEAEPDAGPHTAALTIR